MRVLICICSHTLPPSPQHFHMHTSICPSQPETKKSLDRKARLGDKQKQSRCLRWVQRFHTGLFLTVFLKTCTSTASLVSGNNITIYHVSLLRNLWFLVLPLSAHSPSVPESYWFYPLNIFPVLSNSTSLKWVILVFSAYFSDNSNCLWTGSSATILSKQI